MPSSILLTSPYLKTRRKTEEYRSRCIFFARFSLVSLSIHPRSRRGAGRIRQGEERWSRPPKTALERNELTEKVQFRASHTEAETKKTPDRIPQKLNTIYILVCISVHEFVFLPPREHTPRHVCVVNFPFSLSFSVLSFLSFLLFSFFQLT